MSFKSFLVHSREGDWFALSEPRPLVLSGRTGLIACFVLGEPKRAAVSWKLTPLELQALAFGGVPVQDRIIVFEESDGAKFSYLWLQEVKGVSDARTEMLFSFAPLLVEHGGPPLVCRAVPQRIYNEDLVLDGGVDAPAASWHWTKPHLALGGVVCGAGTAAGNLPGALRSR